MWGVSTASRPGRTVAGVAVVLTSVALAGPDWEEGALNTGDAGAFPSGAQVPKGQPGLTALQTISGGLPNSFEGPGVAGGDEQDMYLIYIDDPCGFSATANPKVTRSNVAGPPLGFDTQLWLFDSSGFGILGNDGTGLSASIGSVATDGSGAAVSAPGLYYVAISPVDSDPTDAAGGPIFDQVLPGEVSGPDGPGGGTPVALWTAGGPGGDYEIVLTGAAFVPCVADINDDGLVNVTDLIEVILGWGTCPTGGGPCDADINGDLVVDVLDLLAVILNWDACNSA